MAAERHARSAPRPSPAPRARPRIVPRTAQQRVSAIRWDRLSRFGLLVVLIGIVGLYIGPARSWMSTNDKAGATRREVAKLRHENARLTSRARALRDPVALEREARRLGMVRKADRAYVVKGLPKGP